MASLELSHDAFLGEAVDSEAVDGDTVDGGVEGFLVAGVLALAGVFALAAVVCEFRVISR